MRTAVSELMSRLRTRLTIGGAHAQSTQCELVCHKRGHYSGKCGRLQYTQIYIASDVHCMTAFRRSIAACGVIMRSTLRVAPCALYHSLGRSPSFLTWSPQKTSALDGGCSCLYAMPNGIPWVPILWLLHKKTSPSWTNGTRLASLRPGCPSMIKMASRRGFEPLLPG